MGTTSFQALPFPDLTDLANVPSAMQTSILAIEKKLVMTYATKAARDASIASPTTNMVTVITNEGIVQMYTGSAWETIAYRNVFTNAAARDAVLTVPEEGMIVTLTTDNTKTIYTGSAWEIAFSYGGTNTWVPVMTATGGSPSVGSTGTIVGSFKYATDKFVEWFCLLTFGGTSISFGTGTLSISLPVAMVTNQQFVGSARVTDSGTANMTRQCISDGSQKFFMVTEAGVALGGTTPMTPAAGDQIFAAGRYRY